MMSAVSGGSYALSWFLLMPFYHKSRNDKSNSIGSVQNEMFDFNGGFQEYLVNNAKPLGAHSKMDLIIQTTVALPFDLLLFNAIRLIFSPLNLVTGIVRVANRLNAQSIIRAKYREGIQSTYQVFPDLQNREHFERPTFWENSYIYAEQLNLTKENVPPISFPTLSNFAQTVGLPSFILNTTVVPPHPTKNVPLRERIFELGSIGFGSDSYGYGSWSETEGFGWEPGEKVEKGWFFDLERKSSPFATIRNFNVASAISGAAISGTGIEQTKARRLIKLLNLGLEYYVPNPSDPSHALRLSDGGHSENLGAYSLLRRKCQRILIVDAEYDPNYKFHSYIKLKEAAKKELNIDINIPQIDSIIDSSGQFNAEIPIMNGTISTDGKQYGKIFYLKLSKSEKLFGDQAEIINTYASSNNLFPQESTIDQYFQPEQFKAYRSLGYAIARTIESDILN